MRSRDAVGIPAVHGREDVKMSRVLRMAGICMPCGLAQDQQISAGAEVRPI